MQGFNSRRAVLTADIIFLNSVNPESRVVCKLQKIGRIAA